MKLEKAIKQDKFSSPYQKLIVNLAYTNSYVTSLLADTLKPFDLSMQQFNVLRILRGQHPKPVSVNNITERMIDRMSNASRLVEKLRKKGLVDRSVCEHDRRQVDVFITEAGLETLSQLDEGMPEVWDKFKHLDPKNVSKFNDFLDQLRINE